MPNWCEGKLTLSCKPLEYITFIKTFFDDDCYDLDFNKIIPEPKRKKDCPKVFWAKGDSCSDGPKRPWFNWYDWRCEMWGSKWNASDTVLEVSMSEALQRDLDKTYDFNIYFSTAWSPVIPVIQELIKKCPTIFIEYNYFEGGMCFAGWINSDYPYDNDIIDVKEFSIAEGFRCLEDYEDEEEE